MAITEKDVLRVAELARLNLTKEDATTYTTQLQRILAHVENLSQVDTEGVEPMTTGCSADKKYALREDVVEEPLPREDALRNAPEQESGCFKVPQIIE